MLNEMKRRQQARRVDVGVAQQLRRRASIATAQESIGHVTGHRFARHPVTQTALQAPQEPLAVEAAIELSGRLPRRRRRSSGLGGDCLKMRLLTAFSFYAS